MLVSSVLPPVIFSKCFWVFHSFSSPTGSIVTFLWLHWLQVFKGCFLPEVLIFNGVQPTYPQGGLQALTDGIYFHVIEKKTLKIRIIHVRWLLYHMENVYIFLWMHCLCAAHVFIAVCQHYGFSYFQLTIISCYRYYNQNLSILYCSMCTSFYNSKSTNCITEVCWFCSS